MTKVDSPMNTSSVGPGDIELLANFPPTPGLLYKYLSPAAIGRMSSGTFRFSQYAALDDPLEFRFRGRRQQIKATISGYLRLVFREMLEGPTLRGNIESTIKDPARFIELRAAIGEEKYNLVVELILEVFFSELAKTFRDETKNIAEQISQKMIFDARRGEVVTFCCSDAWNCIAMWATYATERSGLVIGFESANMFYRKAKNGELSERPYPVVYSDDIPSITASASGISASLLTKDTSWSFQREWRYITDNHFTSNTTDAKGAPIYLRPFNPKAIKEVIMGDNLSAQNQVTLRTTLDALGSSPDIFRLDTTKHVRRHKMGR